MNRINTFLLLSVSLSLAGCTNNAHQVPTPPQRISDVCIPDRGNRYCRPEPHTPNYLERLHESQRFRRMAIGLQEPELLPDFKVDLKNKGAYFEGIYLDPNLPDPLYEALAKDIVSLKTRQFSDPDGKLQAILKTPDLRGETLLKWLQQRVKYILVGDYMGNYKWATVSKEESHQFLNWHDKPQSEVINIGASFFEPGKQLENIPTVKIDGIAEPVEIRSPRAGVLAIGPRMDPPNWLFWPQSDSIRRIGALFNGARQSDGNGDSVGFKQIRCNNDVGEWSINLCDPFTNGGFALQYYIVRSLDLNCNTCSPGSMLTYRAHDFLRVGILPNAIEGDDRPMEELQ